MSFIEDNKNFITINLYGGMKSISDEKKIEKYQEIKAETRRRLKSSYINSKNKLSFYKDVFSELSLYETDFLMLNLFLEKDVKHLFTILSHNSFNNLNFQNEDSISNKFYYCMKEQSYDDIVSEFLKSEFINLLNITPRDWSNEIENLDSPIIREYGKWLINISNDKQIIDKQLIFSYFIFCKLWNNYTRYSDKFDLNIASYYSTINNQFDELLKIGIYPKLFELVNIIKKYKEELFITEIKHYPLLDNSNILDYGIGYTKNRAEFIKRCELSNLLCSSYKDETFSFIFNLMDNSKESIVIKKLYLDILNKLNKFQLPDSLELKEIIENNYSEEVNSLKKDFLRRLYIY
jgi:hypothetical protein